mgnify:CR=1 FL=1
MFSGKHKPFLAGTRYFFCKKDVRFFPSKCPYQGRLHLHLSGLEIRVCGCLTPGSRQKNVTILLKICYMLHVKKLLYS